MEYSNKTYRGSTVIDYRHRINDAMKFIQENSGQTLDIRLIAEVASYSPYHFHRIFAEYVGETLADYVRKVRLKKAALLLINGGKITEVAAESGYLTASSFSKVFRQTFGVTPSHFSAFSDSEKASFTLSSAPLCKKLSDRNFLFPRIIEEPAHQLFYIRMVLQENGLLNEKLNNSFHDVFDKWYKIIESSNMWGNVFRRVGVIRGLTSICPEKSLYDAGFIFNTNPAFGQFPEVEVTEIRQGKWAVFLHKGPYNTLWQTWNWIFNYWLSSSGFCTRQADCFEVYLNYKSNTKPQELLTDIYVPIQNILNRKYI
ncbi:MAG: GyrI-like domain-containing protein [Ferruginibacter sp.]